jgi:hypothetical protein
MFVLLNTSVCQWYCSISHLSSLAMTAIPLFCFCKDKFTLMAVYICIAYNYNQIPWLFVSTSYDIVDSDIDQSICTRKIASRFSRLIFYVMFLFMRMAIIYNYNTTSLTSIRNFTSLMSFPSIICINVPCMPWCSCKVYNEALKNTLLLCWIYICVHCNFCLFAI